MSLLEPSVTFSLGYCLFWIVVVFFFFNAVTCTYISVSNVKNPTNSDRANNAADESQSV